MLTLPDFSLESWLWVAGATFIAGMAKAGLPGLGMLSVLLMSMAMDPRESTGGLLLSLIAADLTAVALFRQSAQWKMVLKVLPAALVGVVLGYFLMKRIPADQFKPVLGWIILSMVALHLVNRWAGKRLETFVQGHGFAAPMGMLGGITTMMANAAGPVMTIYFLAMKLKKMEFVGTVAWFFCLINLFKVPFSIALGVMNFSTVGMTLVVLPLIVIGVFTGRKLVILLPQVVFEWTALVLSAVGGLRLIL